MAYSKSIAAGIVAAAGFIALKWGVTLGVEIEAALLTLVSAAVVWAVPNK